MFDVAIVGAGMAGATAAFALGRGGYKVALIDLHRATPSVFRAEKVEPDQVLLASKLGILDYIAAIGSRITTINSARGGRIFKVEDRLQYGVYYPEMVDAVRRAISGTVTEIQGRVDAIEPSEVAPSVVLASGERVVARVVVMASGLGGKLRDALAIGHSMVSESHSLAIGFDVTTVDGSRFPYPSLTYYSSLPEEAYDCLALFPIRERLRANLFIYRPLGDPWVRRFRREPTLALDALMPGLRGVSPRLLVAPKVEMRPIDLFRVEGAPRPGIVLIADAFQSVCPATGTGLSKLLTDVDVLINDCIPRWIHHARLGTDRIAEFYASERKRRVDDSSLASALYQRSMATSNEWVWRLRRLRRFGVS